MNVSANTHAHDTTEGTRVVLIQIIKVVS